VIPRGRISGFPTGATLRMGRMAPPNCLLKRHDFPDRELGGAGDGLSQRDRKASCSAHLALWRNSRGFYVTRFCATIEWCRPSYSGAGFAVGRSQRASGYDAAWHDMRSPAKDNLILSATLCLNSALGSCMLLVKEYPGRPISVQAIEVLQRCRWPWLSPDRSMANLADKK